VALVDADVVEVVVEGVVLPEEHEARKPVTPVNTATKRAFRA